MCQTQQNFIMFIIELRQHVSIFTESSSGPYKKIDPYLKYLKMRCGIYFLWRAWRWFYKNRNTLP